ncbi:MAG: ABC transporter permease [Actinobacteria bacterium]|nr:ABC transporter permease [Actinomycetota bacterium]
MSTIGTHVADPAPAAPEQGPETTSRTTRQIAWRRFRRHRAAMVGGIVLVVFYLVAIFAPLVAPYKPNDLDLKHSREGPSLRHLMGTDELGRDEFSRVVFGGRISLAVGLGVALSSGLIGTAVGVMAGFYGRFVDNALMRVTDLFLGLPFLAVAMMAARALKGGISDIVIILSAVGWMPVARIVRGMSLSIKEKEYMEAARASGASSKRMMMKHILPNTLGPIIVNVTLVIALAILSESTLSFLGFGIQPPTATWGNMLSGSQDSMLSEPWLVWFPGLMILITVLCVNFVGDGLRDALDPTSAGRLG